MELKKLLQGALLVLAVSAAAADTVLFRDLASGEPREFADYREADKWMVVMIWASDCPVCNREVSGYSDFHLMHEQDDAIILGVSIDGEAGRDDALGFVDNHQVAFENVITEAGAFARRYRELTGTRFVGTPAFLLYDPDGTLRAHQVGAVPVEAIEAFIAGE